MHNAQLSCTEQETKSDGRDHITNIDANNAENTDREGVTCLHLHRQKIGGKNLDREEVCMFSLASK